MESAKKPEKPEFYITLARFYEKYEKWQKAESAYKDAISHAADPH